MLALTQGAFSSKKSGDANSGFSNVCYDGKIPLFSDYKTKLEKFAAGPCSPLVIVPGTASSKLQIVIDCAALKKDDPVTFNLCGWTSCPGDPDYSAQTAPKSEYQIWIPSPLEPMTIISPKATSKQCFAGLVETKYKFIKSDVVLIPKPGVTIKPVGLTNNTRTKAECGADAVENLIPGIVNPENTAYMSTFISRLKTMGYVFGMTAQVVPFDFRVGSKMDEMITSPNGGLAGIIKKMAEITNKKVTIAAHSYGNHRVAQLLWGMSQADKEKYIANYISLAPLFGGTPLRIKDLLCGDQAFQFLNVGFDFPTFSKSVGTFASLFEMLPSAFYTVEGSKNWMNKIRQRINYDKGTSQVMGLDFWPSRDDVCFSQYPSSPNCRSGLYEYDEFGQDYEGIPINSTNYLENILKDTYSENKNYGIFTVESKMDYLPNFGVPMTLVYSSVVDTETVFDFHQDPKTFTSQGKFCDKSSVSSIKRPGDGTVPSVSAVYAGAKFAQDFEASAANAKPVKFVEICSEQNPMGSIWDSQTGTYKMTKNGYIGVPCDCAETKVKHCTHDGMLHLPNLMDFLSEAVQTNERTGISPAYAIKPDDFFKDLVKNCDVLWENFYGPQKSEKDGFKEAQEE